MTSMYSITSKYLDSPPTSEEDELDTRIPLFTEHFFFDVTISTNDKEITEENVCLSIGKNENDIVNLYMELQENRGYASYALTDNILEFWSSKKILLRLKRGVTLRFDTKIDENVIDNKSEKRMLFEKCIRGIKENVYNYRHFPRHVPNETEDVVNLLQKRKSPSKVYGKNKRSRIQYSGFTPTHTLHAYRNENDPNHSEFYRSSNSPYSPSRDSVQNTNTPARSPLKQLSLSTVKSRKALQILDEALDRPAQNRFRIPVVYTPKNKTIVNRPPVTPLTPTTPVTPITPVPQPNFKFSPNSETLSTVSTNLRFDGFQNIGNSCYMNAILQSLLNLAPFRADLLNPQLIESEEVKEDSLYKSVTSVFKKKISKGATVVSPSLLKEVITRTSKRFMGYNQEDAHEFFTECIERIHLDLANVCSSSGPPSPNTSNAKEIPCPVTANFECEVEHTITCDSCNSISTHDETYRDFSLDLIDGEEWDLDGSLDLNLLLFQFFKPEKLLYTCEHCTHTAATVQHKIRRLPRVLVLHLKRFTINSRLGKCIKLTDPVEMVAKLDLAQFCSAKTIPPTYLRATEVIDDLAILKELNREVAGEKLTPLKFADQNFDEFVGNSSTQRQVTTIKEPTISNSVEDEIEQFKKSGSKDLSVLSEEAQLTWVMRESIHETNLELPKSESEKSQEDIDLERAIELSLHDEDDNKENIPEAISRVGPKRQVSSLREEMKDIQNTVAPGVSTRYLLQCVVSHSGFHSRAGHYVCDVRDTATENWVEYNDSIARTLGNWERMNEKRRQQGYLCFFVHDP